MSLWILVDTANVHSVAGDVINENFLFSKALLEKTTGEEVFWVTSEYVEKGGLKWENCRSGCIDSNFVQGPVFKNFKNIVLPVACQHHLFS